VTRIAWLLLCVACAHRNSEVGAPEIETGLAIMGPAGSGTVIDAIFTDRTFGFTIPVPEAWVAEPGPETGQMRVAFDHVPTGTRVEMWVFGAGSLEPRMREGCKWTFRDTGHFSVLESMGEVAVATCVPDDPEGERVYAYIFERADRVVQIEVHSPAAALVAGKSAGDDVIRGLRW